MEARTIPGKYAILTMLVLGVAAAAYTQFYYARLQRRPIELWGGYNAQLMMNAPLVNAMLLAPTDNKAGAEHLERLMVGGEHLSVLAEKDVTNQPGFSHVRQSLVNDTSFDWSGPDKDCKPEWKYGLEFSNGEHTALLLIAPNCGLARLTDTGATGAMRPVMPGIERFLREQFPEKK
ncbi:MAG TPA: hypothetical protein VHV55_03265 [Pirellulales bacterium]|jgi:hypothetical protein|nr:hypothetical protein [Pirellulales bacterium]